MTKISQSEKKNPTKLYNLTKGDSMYTNTKRHQTENKIREIAGVSTFDTLRRVLEIFSSLLKLQQYTPPSAARRVINAWRLECCISTRH